MFASRRTLVCLLLLLANCLVAAEPALACPGCKVAMENQRTGGDWQAGYMWSILFMMSMPFTLLAAFSGYMYWEVRRARAAQAAQPDGTSSSRADQGPVASRTSR